MEYRVQFSNAWSEKNGDEVPSETMSLEDAQRFIADHPETLAPNVIEAELLEE